MNYTDAAPPLSCVVCRIGWEPSVKCFAACSSPLLFVIPSVVEGPWFWFFLAACSLQLAAGFSLAGGWPTQAFCRLEWELPFSAINYTEVASPFRLLIAKVWFQFPAS